MTPTEHKLPYGFARETGILADLVSGEVRLLLNENFDPVSIPEALRALGGASAIVKVTPSEFDVQLSAIYSGSDFEDTINQSSGDESELMVDLDSVLEGAEQSADLLAGDDDAPVIRLLNSLLSEAVRAGASDIHLEPFEKSVSVRLRVDGFLSELASLTPRLAPFLVSRIKVMSRLDIAEKRLPQDGRLSLTLGGSSFDVRVSTLPVRFGERVVMRLLDNDSARISLQDLGMPAEILRRMQSSLAEPNGIILVTGPTGSGKTTTLYAALSLLNERSRNIMTVEDPIEYALPGISQTQVNAKIGMTFAGGLRSILRQDPDIVMVGEIRDMETAEMAVQASLTGHLVLSTVHTNSAISAVTRLLDMGVERFLLASSVKAILAQRLIRMLCKKCAAPTELTGEMAALLRIDDTSGSTVKKPVGCDSCQHSGYQGRTGIYELVQVNGHVRKMIQDGASEQELEAIAFKEHPTLSDSGRALVLAGQTTLEEVMRVSRLSETDDASL